MVSLNNMCAPLQVYIVISIISVITFVVNTLTGAQIKNIYNPGANFIQKDSVKNIYLALLIKILFLVLYGYLLQVLCNNNLDKVAWIIMFMPFILIAFITLYAMAIGGIMAVRGQTGLLSGGFKVGGKRR